MVSVLRCHSFSKRILHRCGRQFSNYGNRIVFSDPVRHAIENGLPVVALESTIITHGMPYPENITCALQVEEEVRLSGSVPATVAILAGQLTIGLTTEQIEYIGNSENCVKTSRRDFAHVMATKKNGGTTVSGTLLAAHLAGIKVMATGGIGGVHRNGQTTMDVSADLQELGKTPVAVVSSGIKSILDIPRTLEYLETQGVYVATYGPNKKFPAFYTKESGCEAPYNVCTPLEAAQVISYSTDVLNLQSGMLFAVPVPQESALDNAYMNTMIEEALLRLAAKEGVSGKEVTPFLLAHVARMTGGKSLATNMALVQNNAKVAGEIAAKLWELSRDKQSSSGDAKKTTVECKSDNVKAPIVVIGGSVLDRCVTLLEANGNDSETAGPAIKTDGRIHEARISESAGGVGRNIYEALRKLNGNAVLVTALANDQSGKFLLDTITGQQWGQQSQQQQQPQPGAVEHANRIAVVGGTSTSQVIVVFDAKGECKFLIGDMEAHKSISPQLIREHETSTAIRQAPLVVLDGNVPVETMEVIFDVASIYSVPVFFEPTDYLISKKPFQSNNHRVIKYISPNYMELTEIAKHFNVSHSKTAKNQIESAAHLAKKVVEHVPNIFVTLGTNGVLIARRNTANDALLTNRTTTQEVQLRHYQSPKCEDLVNVSGAGDCFAAGVIRAMVHGLSEEKCIHVGLNSALQSLKSKGAIPDSFPIGDKDYSISAYYTTIAI